MLEGGVDLLVLETIGSLDEMTEAVGAARGMRSANRRLDDIRRGRPHHWWQLAGGGRGAALRELGVAAIGANCSVGPQRLLPVAEALVRHLASGTEPSRRSPACPTPAGPRMSRARHLPVVTGVLRGVRPGAAEAGVRIIGGCCGTTPAHGGDARGPRCMDGRTRRWSDLAVPLSRRTPVVARASSPRRSSIVPAEGPTRLREKLDRGEFVVSVEIDPPKGLNPTKALDGACLLQEAGVDFINVADSPMARVRMSALTMCYLIQHRTGMETILHFTTRDRSLMGLQSELLGAHAVGVRNIIALTGDPPSLGDYPDSSAVYDVDSIGLIRILDRLNTGADSAGRRSAAGRVHHRLRR